MTFLVVAILAIAVASVAGYFSFSQNLSEKVAAINSFEECAKHYPVMESYPEQCNTPDGKHFTRELSEEEAKRQIQQMGKAPPAISQDYDETSNWKTFYSVQKGISFKYPENFKVTESNNEIDVSQDIEFTNFAPLLLYINIIPDDYNGPNLYNYNPTDTEKLLNLDVGQEVVINGAEGQSYAKSFTYKRGSNINIDNFQAKTFQNDNPWEFPKGTREKRLFIKRNSSLIQLGTYIDSQEVTEKKFNEILSTLKITQ